MKKLKFKAIFFIFVSLLAIFALSIFIFRERKAKANADIIPISIMGIAWNGLDSGSNPGETLDIFNIPNDHGSAVLKQAIPDNGSICLLQTDQTLGINNINVAKNIDTIIVNGVPISEIDTAVVAESYAHLLIYVPCKVGSVIIKAGTQISNYTFTSDYYYRLRTFTVGSSTYGTWTNVESLLGVSSINSVWGGCDQSGRNGGFFDDIGVEHNHGDSISGAVYPTKGAFELFKLNVNVNDMGGNIAPYLNTVYVNGVPISMLDGAYIGGFAAHFIIYAPVKSGYIEIKKGTVICDLIFEDDFYFAIDEAIYSVNGYSCGVISKAHKATITNNIDNESNFKIVKDNEPLSLSPLEKEGLVYFDTTLKGTSTSINPSTFVVTSNVEIEIVYKTLKKVNLVSINIDWNDNRVTLNNGMAYTLLMFDGVESSGYAGTNENFADLFLKSTYNGVGFPYAYFPASFLYGPNDSRGNAVIFFGEYVASEGDIIQIQKGARFNVGGNDPNIYEIENDIKIEYHNSKWECENLTYTVYRDGVNPTQYVHYKKDGKYVYNLPSATGSGTFTGYAVTENGVNKFLYPGTFELDTPNLIFIAVYGSFKMNQGAAIKINGKDSSGLKWSVNVDDAFINNIAFWAKKVEYGMELSSPNLSSNFDSHIRFWSSTNSYSTTLIDISGEYFDYEFNALAYVDITYYDDKVVRIYADSNDNTRTIRYIAGKALEDSQEYSESELNILNHIYNYEK